MRVYDSSRWLPAMEQPPTTNEPDACNWRLHEKKQATTTPSKNHNHIPHVYSGLVTHLRKEWRCERVLVEGEGKGEPWKRHFHGEGGKVWDSASSGSQRRTNNFNDNSSFTRRTKRGTSISNDLVICHAYQPSSIARSKFESGGRWNERERSRKIETRKRREWERKKEIATYTSFLLILIYLWLSRRILLHPLRVATCSRGDRFPAPSPFLLLCNCNRGGDSQWRSYLLRVSVRRVRNDFSARTEYRIAEDIIRLLLLRRAITPGRCPGEGERGGGNPWKRLLHDRVIANGKLTSVSLFLSPIRGVKWSKLER